MYCRGVELRIRRADLLLPTINVRVYLAVERIVADKAVKVGRGDLLRLAGQVMYTACERYK